MIKFVIGILLTVCIYSNALNVEKIQPALLLQLEDNTAKDIIIYMKNYMNFETHMHQGRLLSSYTADERAEIIVHTLEELTKRSQKSIQKDLTEKFKLNYESYWISNCLLIKSVTKSVIFGLSDRTDIEKILYDAPITVDPIEEKSAQAVANEQGSKKNVEFNIKWVKADRVWARGHDGSGMVVGVCDTGLIHTHPAIRNAYRGHLGNGRFNHDYSWRGRGNAPTDSHGHGTHCSGTVAGGVDRKIGVAPGAKLIHCAGLGGVSVISCLQWFLAPTKVDGSGRDTRKRPHVTSHSYRSGASYNREYLALLGAGVHVVNSGGNQGSRCGSVNANTVTRGQITISALKKNSNDVTNFSARGPSTVRTLVRPTLSAPGESVVSASNRGGYRAMSGTSMSCPNVAGGVALLWSAIPQLRRNIEATNDILFRSSLGQRDNDCGSRGSPNNKFGYGTVDYEKAVSLAKFKYGIK